MILNNLLATPVAILALKLSNPSSSQNSKYLIKNRIFGHGNQLSRYDLDSSNKKWRADCATVPGSSGEIISLYEEENSINLLSCRNGCCVESVQMRSFFWSVFSSIRIEYGDLRSKFLLSRPYPLKLFRGCLPQNLLRTLLNTLSQIILPMEVNAELNCWVQNLNLSKGKSIISQLASQLIIASNASLKEWRTFYQRRRTGG